ncbi:antitoxin component of MazEF toxin-antitoxin module [Bradyrhizobium sp. i1.4.4]
MSVEISTKWLLPVSDVKTSETDATLARLLIRLGGRSVTEFKDHKGEVSQHIEIPAYFIAEWIAENWWPLLWEPRKSEDDEPNAAFLSRHSLLSAQHGFALPRMLIVPIGRSVQISVGARNVPLAADARFLHNALETIPRDQLEKELRGFVSTVVERLGAHRIVDTYLQDAWQLVQETGPDEELFCRFVGALGKSPYDVDEGTASLIERLLPMLGERLLMDLCLVSPADSFQAVAVVAEQAFELTKDASTSTLSPLETLAAPKDNTNVPAFRRGIRAAELLRQRFGIKDTDPNGASRIFEKLRLDTGRRVATSKNDDEILITGAVVRDESDMKVALLQSTEAKRRFAGARAIFSAWSAETPNEHRLLTSAVTRDQQANRAFAAEITAPRNLIRSKARRNRLSHDDVYDLAGDLQIGPDVVKKQALNNGIEVAPN